MKNLMQHLPFHIMASLNVTVMWELSLHGDFDLLIHAVVGIGIDIAGAGAFGGDLAASADRGDLLIRAQVAYRGNVALRHEFLFLILFDCFGLELEGLAFIQGHPGLVHRHGFRVGISLVSAGGE